VAQVKDASAAPSDTHACIGGLIFMATPLFL
jgi:hypothetical protein